MSILTDADQELLPKVRRGVGGFHLGTQWYCQGWTPLPKQYAFHQIDVPNVTFLAGIAAGKTTAVAASYLMDCISIPYFGALNTSVTLTQAELVFDMVNSWIEGNPRLEHLVNHIALRPWPIIEFKNFSYWHFRTMGKDAKFIRGSEYDRINVDEAGLLYDDTALKTLRGRLRGKRPDGTQRMSRLDATTSPTDAPWLRERFQRGVRGNPRANLDDYRSIRATIYENTHLTKQQIRLMEEDYTDEMIDVELKALFPDYGMTTFPKRHLDAVQDMALNDRMTSAVRPEDGKPRKGWRIEEHPRHGMTHWEMPRVPGARYVLAGDPGTGDPPKRNAGVVIVFRTDVKPYDLVYFDWVFGRGSYNPFLRSFKYAIDTYDPVLRGLDATGPQRALEELAFENEGIRVDGLNFQRDKDAMLNALIMATTNHTYRVPVIKGWNNQMRHYRREDDKKLAQDIVMTMAEAAYLFRWLPEEMQKEVRSSSHNYRSRKRRTSVRNRRQRTR